MSGVDIPVLYPTPADVIRAHAEALGVALGTARHHVLHRGLLESAVAKPQWHARYADADLFSQAAVLAQGLCTNHGFVDGNKRTAWVAMRAFLIVNGYSVTSPPLEAADRMIAQTRGTETIDDLARWLREHARQVDS